MNKVTSTLSTSQEHKFDFIPSSMGFPLNNINQSAKDILREVIMRCGMYQSFYARQDTIGKWTGYCRQTVNEQVKKLSFWGFIFKGYRPGKKTCEYFVNAFFFTAPGRLILIIIFSISFLCVAPPGYPTQLSNINVTKNAQLDILASADDVNVPLFYKKGSQDSRGIGSPCTPLAIAEEFYNQSAWNATVDWHDKPSFISSTEFDAIFYAERICLSADDNHPQEHLKGNKKMYNFTKEQCQEISRYPETAIKRAMQRVSEVTAQGNPPPNLFQWFSTICRTYKPGEEERSPIKNPETGKPKRATNNNHYLRTKDNWIEGHDVVQTPGTRQSTVKIVESQMEWAINVEKTLHDRFLHDAHFNKKAAQYANPLGEMLPQSILDEIHHGCECRSNVIKELDIKVQQANCRQDVDSSSTTELATTDSVCDKTSRTPEPVTKFHNFDWNSLVPDLLESGYDDVLD